MTTADSNEVVSLNRAASKSQVLGLPLLTALVVGSMIGAGGFGLPQNIAAKAGPLAILIGWGITGVEMLALALVYQSLSLRKPARQVHALSGGILRRKQRSAPKSPKRSA